ncbi:MAG: hypothetical protein LBK46_03725 [Oscillospiraceae bacterium]|nr:hypothetical protein [Oscillospiraceae bacterium]
MPNYFQLEATVSPDQCGADHIMRPDAWFQFFQWVSGEHSREMRCDRDGDLPEPIIWVLLGAHAEWRSQARCGDALHVDTAPAANAHGMYQRRIIVTNNDGSAVAASVGYWTLMDRVTRRITRSDMVQRRHEEEQIGHGIRPTPFEPLTGARVDGWSYTPGDIDIDENGHVNNARYVAWMDSALRESTGIPTALQSLDVWYAAEVMPGEALTGWLARLEDGQFTFEVFRRENEKACFTASGVLM